jgi:hypothetical protein
MTAAPWAGMITPEVSAVLPLTALETVVTV